MRSPVTDVSWDETKKCWQVRIQVGAEVIKRPAHEPREADDAMLRSVAARTASDEGYTIDPDAVTVHR